MLHRHTKNHHDGSFGGALGVFVLTLLAAKLLWAWVVPVLFSGAVAAGTVGAVLPWASAALIAGATAAAVFFVRHPRHHAHAERHLAEDGSRV